MAAQSAVRDLYPIGTDICDYYGFKNSATKAYLSEYDGQVYEGSYWTSADYAEINPSYTYAKKYYRLYRICYYDKDKNYVGHTERSNNLIDGQVIEGIPANARYLRVSMYKPNGAANMDRVGIVRIE